MAYLGCKSSAGMVLMWHKNASGIMRSGTDENIYYGVPRATGNDPGVGDATDHKSRARARCVLLF